MRWIALVVLALVPTFPAAAHAAAAPPANDAFSAATAIREQGRLETSNAGATKEAGEPAHAANAGGASVWFRWTAPREGQFAFETAGSDFDTLLAVYTGPALGALQPLAADDDAGPRLRSELSFRAVAGTVYHVAVDGFQGKVGRLQLAWGPAPANDNFADARVIEGRAGTIASPGVRATEEAGEPGRPDQSVWFRWTAPGDMRIGFRLRPIAGTVVAYTGTSFDTLAPLVEDRPPIFRARAEATYHIAVEAAQADSVLVWQARPPNDDFADAARIAGRTGRAGGTNFVASRQRREPLHGGGARASIWYRWRAPRTGVLRLRTTRTNYDTLLAVYRGTRLGALRWLASDDDSGRGSASAVDIRVRRGRDYRIAVDGFGGQMGDFVLRWTLSRRGRLREAPPTLVPVPPAPSPG